MPLRFTIQNGDRCTSTWSHVMIFDHMGRLVSEGYSLFGRQDAIKQAKDQVVWSLLMARQTCLVNGKPSEKFEVVYVDLGGSE